MSADDNATMDELRIKLSEMNAMCSTMSYLLGVAQHHVDRSWPQRQDWLGRVANVLGMDVAEAASPTLETTPIETRDYAIDQARWSGWHQAMQVCAQATEGCAKAQAAVIAAWCGDGPRVDDPVTPNVTAARALHLCEPAPESRGTTGDGERVWVADGRLHISVPYDASTPDGEATVLSAGLDVVAPLVRAR